MSDKKRLKGAPAGTSAEDVWVTLFTQVVGSMVSPTPDVFREIMQNQQHSPQTPTLHYVPIATISAELFGFIGEAVPPPNVDNLPFFAAPVYLPSPVTSFTAERWRSSNSNTPAVAPRNAWETLSQLLDFFDQNRNVVLFANATAMQVFVEAMRAADEADTLRRIANIIVLHRSPLDAVADIQEAEADPQVRASLRALIRALRGLARSEGIAAGFARHRDLYNAWLSARMHSSQRGKPLETNETLMSAHKALVLSMALLRLAFIWFLDMGFDDETSAKTLQQLSDVLLSLPDAIYNRQLTSMRALRTLDLSITKVRDFYANTLRWTPNSKVPLPETYRDQLPITARANEPLFWTSRDLAKVIRERREPIYVDDKHRIWGHARGSLARHYIETRMVDGHQRFLMWCYFPKSRSSSSTQLSQRQYLPSVQGASWYNHQGQLVKPETVTLYGTGKDMTPRGPSIVSFVLMSRLDETRLHSSPISAVYLCVTGEPANGLISYYNESQTS